MPGRLRSSSVRFTLFAILVGLGIYMAGIGGYVFLEMLPSAARMHARAAAMQGEYEAVHARIVLLGDAFERTEELSRRNALGAADRRSVDSLRAELGAVAEEAAGVQASLVLGNIPPSMRASLAEAANAESRLAGTLLEALTDLDAGAWTSARRWVDTARTARRDLVARVDASQRLGLEDMRDRERAIAEGIRRTAQLAALWGALGVALALVAAAVIQRRLFDPLAALDRGLARIAAGDWDVSLPVRRPDELGRLTAQFNEMTSVLRARPEVEALRRSEMRFRAAFETGSDAYVIVEWESGRLLEVNNRFEAMYGYRREEVVGRTGLELGVWTEPGQREALLAELAKAGEVRDWKVVARRKSGETFPALYSVGLLKTDGQHLILGVIRDLSRLVRTEEDLRRIETNYRDLVERLPIGIYRTTMSGRILTANAALVQLLGYDSADEMLALDMVHDVYAAPEMRADLLKQFEERDEAVTEMRWRRKDGRLITVRMRMRTLRSPAGAPDGIEGVAEDVTEQRSLEEQFRQAQRLEAVGRLAGGIAHDFNNVLTAITGYSELLLDGFDAKDQRRQDLEEIRAAARRAAGLTRQLLAFSRKQVLQAQILNLNDVVQGVEKMIQRLIGEDVLLTFAPGPGLGTIHADPGQVEQVILNLAVNSRDAMPKGGRLTIETANVELDESYCREHTEIAPGPFVMLAVSDTGAGMDAETRSHIFEPFFTTKELGKGTGLGLATVYGIVKQSGGHIAVYSEFGHGATFKIYLPRAEQPVAVAEAGSGVDDVVGGRETVLLVEDDAAVRNVAAGVLRQKGYRVLPSGDGAAALVLAREQRDRVDLLLTDLVMPGMTGREVAQSLTALRPEMRVLYMSGYTDDAVVRHQVLEEGAPFLQKPFTPRTLAMKVREVLDA